MNKRNADLLLASVRHLRDVFDEWVVLERAATTEEQREAGISTLRAFEEWAKHWRDILEEPIFQQWMSANASARRRRNRASVSIRYAWMKLEAVAVGLLDFEPTKKGITRWLENGHSEFLTLAEQANRASVGKTERMTKALNYPLSIVEKIISTASLCPENDLSNFRQTMKNIGDDFQDLERRISDRKFKQIGYKNEANKAKLKMIHLLIGEAKELNAGMKLTDETNPASLREYSEKLCSHMKRICEMLAQLRNAADPYKLPKPI